MPYTVLNLVATLTRRNSAASGLPLHVGSSCAPSNKRSSEFNAFIHIGGGGRAAPPNEQEHVARLEAQALLPFFLIRGAVISFVCSA